MHVSAFSNVGSQILFLCETQIVFNAVFRQPDAMKSYENSKCSHSVSHHV